MMLNRTQTNTILLLRKHNAFPRNEEEFFNYIKEFDKNPFNIEKVINTQSVRLYFSIGEYFDNHKDEIKDIIKFVL